MSKITQALEKAARERGHRPAAPQEPTVTAGPVVVSVTPVFTRRGVGHVASAGQVKIDPHIISAADPKSPIAEQYRMLRANLESLHMRPSVKVIVVTSAVRGEGKSVTAVNLALTFARKPNMRVVLVDADMRKSSVPKWLGLTECRQGLSTILQQDGELDGSLIRLEYPPLNILPAGPCPDHPAELLQSTNMRRLLATLRAEFDLVVLDAPPLLPVADPGILASQADGALLVVRIGKTHRKAVLEAQGIITKLKAKVLGCVLTHVEHYLPGYERYYRYYQQHEQREGRAPSTQAPEATSATS